METIPSRHARRARAAALPEQRIYIRTDTTTRHIRLGPLSQLAGFVVVAALLAWTGFATASYVVRAFDPTTADARFATARDAYEAHVATLTDRQQALEAELAEANARRDAVTERLSEKQAHLVETGAELQEARTELAVLRQKVEVLSAGKRDDAARIAALEGEVAGLEGTLARAETETANLDAAFEQFSTAMEKVISERDFASTEAAQLREEVAALSGDLGNLEDRQRRLISRLSEAARATFAGLESLFTRSDLDLERILAEARQVHSGAGGPFRPLDEASRAALDEGDTRVAALMRELETVNLMRFAATRLPFGEPVLEGRMTSAFGPRTDPHGRGRSVHEGMDFAGPRGTPIHATADGIVTFEGRQSGYGKIVKIRHAFGFETVYAHLHRARVKTGQRVARGDRIGDMGNTGRSTGTHVHYEIRIDNSPVNPVKFIEAARDVL